MTLPVMVRKNFRCVIVDPRTDFSLCTGITVNVPSGLTRQQAIDYVTGAIATEISRYAASEALGFGPFGPDTNWSDIVT
jgi:hypothetical protein